ncbi:uncharacterized protein EDB93DRAFT_1116235 [Suillus bovinus]|uniref:uncharacterized protein n=1 Tax=Suillus bovinus TaxID=48563 RepID=UPI001B862C7C|nr:uncharacterized protein EDB93DRAFT_1116235 [Suillus bovinus]KAG2159552.1 hypothetical protein EDB93DRAFT_1116235 [Suillus bovinus]
MSLLSTDISASSLSSLSPKFLEIASILTAQADKIRQRDQSIIMMQSKLDSQQAVIEEIRSEQQQLISSVASFMESNEQRAQKQKDTSAALSSPIVLETPEPATPDANPGVSPCTFSVPKLPSSPTTPTPAFHPSSYRKSTPAAYANLRTATADDGWRVPEHYIKAQRGGRLRRQGAFYGIPDWTTMSAISASYGVHDSGAPPSPPASSQIQEEAENCHADVRTPVEVMLEIDAAVDAVKAALSNESDRAPGTSSRDSCKRFRDLDEHEARKTANRTHPYLRTATVDDRWRIPKHYIKAQRGGRLQRQGAFYGTPDWITMSAISASHGVHDSGALPPSPPANPQVKEEAENSRVDVHTPMKVTQEIDAAADAVKAAVSNEGDRASSTSSRNSCKRCRDPDEQEARTTANRMDISSIVHTTPDRSSSSVLSSLCSTGHGAGGSNRDGSPKRRRVAREIVDSDAVSDTKRPIRRSLRHAMPR